MRAFSQTESQSKRHLTRRELLRNSLVAAAPLIIPVHVLGSESSPAANDRIHIGLIGAGIRGRQLIGDMPADGRIVAISDCFLPRIQRILKPETGLDMPAAFGEFVDRDASSCTTYADYRKMIEEAKLDAVVVAAPDIIIAQARGPCLPGRARCLLLEAADC